MIEVVKVNQRQDNFTVYIGREWAGIAESPFHNPYHAKGRKREDVLIDFTIYWYAPEQKWLRQLASIMIPPNSVLGCWCRTKDIPHDILHCHGDIIAGYLTWKDAQVLKANRGLFDAI